MAPSSSHGGRNSWELTPWTLSRKLRAVEMAWGFETSKLAPSDILLIARPLPTKHSQTVLLIQDQVFKHMSLVEDILVQTTICINHVTWMVMYGEDPKEAEDIECSEYNGLSTHEEVVFPLSAKDSSPLSTLQFSLPLPGGINPTCLSMGQAMIFS